MEKRLCARHCCQPCQGERDAKIGTHAEEGHVEDHEMQSHTEGDRRDQIGVAPERHDQQRFVLAQRVAGIEHLDDWRPVIRISEAMEIYIETYRPRSRVTWLSQPLSNRC